MNLPKLTKGEALRLECARIAGNDAGARLLYQFITECREPVVKGAHGGVKAKKIKLAKK